MRRLLATCLALGLPLLYSRAAEARPSLEVSTTLGGADATEYLVRVANPESFEDKGVLELRRSSDGPAVSSEPFSVPANSTRYFRLPGGKGRGLDAVAVTSEGTFHAQERYTGSAGLVVFDIPRRDSQRLEELRVHTSGANIVVSHAVFDDTTKTPVLTKRPAVYDGIALVMVPSSVFLSLPLEERDALTTWVRTGGSIALSVDEGDGPTLSTIFPTENAHRHTLGTEAELGLGHVYFLAVDPWAEKLGDDVATQEKLAQLVDQHQNTNHFFGEPWMDAAPPSLDPNRGYRPVIPLVGLLLVAQAIIAALGFRRLATKKGMGPAYRFVAGSSAITFGAVIGLGIYSKGGFSPRARELSFVDVASGDSTAWVERKTTYFAGTEHTVSIAPRDPLNDLVVTRDLDVLRGVDGRGAMKINDLTVQPWQTAQIAERGTTTLNGAITVAYEHNDIVVHNTSGSVLRNVLVSNGTSCFGLGTLENGGTKKSSLDLTIPCGDLGAAWADYAEYPDELTRYFYIGGHPVLIGQIDDQPSMLNGFKLEKRTTVVRVRGAS